MLVGLGSSSWALGIGVAVFTFFSGIASAFLLVINIRNGQHYNYVSILAIVIALSNFNSFTQQIYTLLNFSELMLEAFQLATEMFQCNGSEPFPLFHTTDKNVSAFLSIQMFFINSQGLLFFYWSLILFASSWSLSPVWWKNQKAIVATKISCFALPGLQLGVLRLNVLRGNDFAQLIIMNCIILINIGMGSVFLVLTLLHVISVHREARGATEVRLSRTYDGVVEFLPREGESEKGFKRKTGLGRLYISSDGWLIARIALAFVMVEGLQIYMIVMQIFFLQRWAHFRLEWSRGLLEPLVDQSEEFANICSPIPGSFTGYLFFFVFGTTAESQAEIQKINLAVRRWFCGCFRRSKDNKTGKASFNNQPASKRAFGSRNISYPKPESDSLLLSPAFSVRTISSKQPIDFSSKRYGSSVTPIILAPSASVPSIRTRVMEDHFQYEFDPRYRPRLYSSISTASTPATAVSLGYLRSQYEQTGSPRFWAHGCIPSPPATKRIFCPDPRRFPMFAPPMIIYTQEKPPNRNHIYLDMRRESG